MQVSVCQSAAAVDDFRTAHSEDLEPGSVVFARLLADGEQAHDPLVYDPQRARRAFEEQQKRLGLTDGG